MAQIFHPSFNTFAKASIFGFVFLVAGAAWVLLTVMRSPYVTQAGVAQSQPVPFSHAHHVGGLGIDCRYCHTSVEETAFAGMPETAICMNCHSQIWADSPMLEPVRDSWRSGRSIAWTRVHDLPDFVYFDHSIHVAKGVACVTCHGRVDEMPLMWREHPLHMDWCLDCHRRPERFIAPRDMVFQPDWEPSLDQATQGLERVADYGIQTRQLTDCSICHR
jgi:hypothetical protein